MASFIPDVPRLITRIATLVIALTVHEFAHAWTANRLGDETPRLHGRLTLNPLAHLDVLGSLMLVLVGFGWAKPVPINPYALQRRARSGTMLVSAAGPFSNLFLAILAAIPFKAGLLTYPSYTGRLLPSPASFLNEFIGINLILFLFNLVPLFPLDGEKVAEYFLPIRWRDTMYRLRPYGPMILIALLFLGPLLRLDVFGWLIGWPADQLRRLLVY